MGPSRSSPEPAVKSTDHAAAKRPCGARRSPAQNWTLRKVTYREVTAEGRHQPLAGVAQWKTSLPDW